MRRLVRANDRNWRDPRLSDEAKLFLLILCQSEHLRMYESDVEDIFDGAVAVFGSASEAIIAFEKGEWKVEGCAIH